MENVHRAEELDADFSLPLSPEFYLGAGWAFKLWGVNWPALVRISIAFAVLTFALHSIALSYVVPRRYAIAIALVCQTLAMMVTSYWCIQLQRRDHGVSLVLGVVCAGGQPRLEGAGDHLLHHAGAVERDESQHRRDVDPRRIVAAGDLVRELRTRLLVWVACSAVLVLLLLAVCHLNPVDILKAYLGMAGSRGTPDIRNLFRSKPNEAFISLPLLGACFAAVLVVCRSIYRAPRDRRPPRLGQVVSIASAGLAVGTCCILMRTRTEPDQRRRSDCPLVVESCSVGGEGKGRGCRRALRADNRGLPVWLRRDAGPGPLRQVTVSHPVGLDGPFAALPHVRIGWTALVAMSIAAFFVASLGDSSSPDWRWTEKLRGWPTILTIVLVTSGAAASYVSAKRLRVGINGVGLFYSREPEVAIDLPFFQGFSVSPHLKAVAEQLDES